MASPPADLQAQIDSKSSTIESMELEISKLKARVESQESGATTEKEQVTQLEDKLAQAEAASSKAEQELSDLRSQLERATEKAVTEARTRASAEAKVESLEKEVSEAKAAKEALEKKVATLTTLHKEQDARSQALRKEVADSKARSEKLESENAKLRSRKSVEGGGGLDDEGVDELEDEERLRLEKKIRELEAEVHELRSGAWIEKRRELEATSPGFQDIDLSNNTHLGINANNIYNKRQSHSGGASGRIGDFFTNGLNALAGTGGGDDEGFLDDDDEDFDEAFRVAQEQETNRRLERIKDIKRSLKHWEGWRLDIVDMRRGGGVEGVGPIFDI